MCRVICSKCKATHETKEPGMCFFVGRLKFTNDVNPGALRGACPKCGAQYTALNPPSIFICQKLGQAGYEKAREQYEFQKRVTGMNAELFDKIKKKKTLGRKVA